MKITIDTNNLCRRTAQNLGDIQDIRGRSSAFIKAVDNLSDDLYGVMAEVEDLRTELAAVRTELAAARTERDHALTELHTAREENGMKVFNMEQELNTARVDCSIFKSDLASVKKDNLRLSAELEVATLQQESLKSALLKQLQSR